MVPVLPPLLLTDYYKIDTMLIKISQYSSLTGKTNKWKVGIFFFFLFGSTMAKTFIFMKIPFAKPIHFFIVVGSYNFGQGQLLFMENGKQSTRKDQA